jgi:Domain of unknown function (DUF4389)
VVDGVRIGAADEELATLRLRVASPGDGPVFVGIARSRDVNAYLQGVAHDQIRGVTFDPFSFDADRSTGGRSPVAPARQSFWAATAQGTGTQTLRWDVRSGTWSVVAMNADGSPGVVVDASIGAKVRYVLAAGIGLLVIGLAALAGGLALSIRGLRVGDQALDPTQPRGAVEIRHVGGVMLEGRLDEDISRWRWLVKWILAIPHWIVLCFLWLAFWILSIVAFFAILVTGRYPRGIFDFNVGVIRWTWRVSFYGYSALATDRYPPFTLRDVSDYPARFDVAYPERLSRGLVLVKSWLLAIPHLIVVAILTGGWALGAPGFWSLTSRNAGWEGLPGLIAILALIAGGTMLFGRRYSRDLFDLVMGLNRWVYRVLAYVSLMRDEYPPLRLDPGAHEPESSPPHAQEPPPVAMTP